MQASGLECQAGALRRAEQNFQALAEAASAEFAAQRRAPQMGHAEGLHLCL
jgi:hypothetical protein